MKIKFSAKIFAVFGIFILGLGMGVGGMFLKERFFPGSDTKIVFVEKKPDEIGPLVEFEEFLVNLDGGGIVKTVLTVEGVNAKSEEKLREKEIFLRDRIITVLSSKKITEIQSGEGREKLKEEMVAALNEVCPDQVKDVLFKSFIYSM